MTWSAKRGHARAQAASASAQSTSSGVLQPKRSASGGRRSGASPPQHRGWGARPDVAMKRAGQQPGTPVPYRRKGFTCLTIAMIDRDARQESAVVEMR